MQNANIEQINFYKKFLEKIDSCGLIGDDLYETISKQNMLNTDLGSMMDINLINGFIQFSENNKKLILEIGGGYGRLAEAFTNGTDSDLHYVLVDAVPASLMYAKKYLEKAFPHKRIGFYLDNSYDTSYDFYILPPWKLDQLSSTKYDLCINIESMQEMVKTHVDFYIELFNNSTKDNGYIYISNSRKYKYTDKWNFPENWEILFCHNTPRSWTNDHPTMLFKKTTQNHSRQNRIHEGLHSLEISDWDLRLENKAMKNEISSYKQQIKNI